MTRLCAPRSSCLTRMKRKRTSRLGHQRAGVALLEVIVASGLMLIAIVPILKALTTAQVTSRLVEQKTHCLALAQAKVSEIQAKSIGNFETDYSVTGASLGGGCLCNVVDSSSATLKKLSVAVGHDHDGNGSITGREIMVTLVTQIAKRN